MNANDVKCMFNAMDRAAEERQETLRSRQTSEPSELAGVLNHFAAIKKFLIEASDAGRLELDGHPLDDVPGIVDAVEYAMIKLAQAQERRGVLSRIIESQRTEIDQRDKLLAELGSTVESLREELADARAARDDAQIGAQTWASEATKLQYRYDGMVEALRLMAGSK